MLISLTVGKVDAGVAVLLTEDNRLVSSIYPHHFLAYTVPIISVFMSHSSMTAVDDL